MPDQLWNSSEFMDKDDFSLIHPADSRSAILNACIKCWFAKSPNPRLMNWGDCSGFVKSVQKELFLLPFDGDATAIGNEVYARTDWQVLGVGSSAVDAVDRAVAAGRLVVAVWQAPPGSHGHVMIVTMRATYAGQRVEQQLIGSWGVYGSVGETFGRLSKSFGSAKHKSIIYACSNDLIVPSPDSS